VLAGAQVDGVKAGPETGADAGADAGAFDNDSGPFFRALRLRFRFCLFA
jgi:hypothetical protein